MINQFFYKIFSAFKKYIKLCQEFIYPFECLLCQTYLNGETGLCNKCTQQLEYINQNYCRQCGYPFELSVGSVLSCVRCLQKPPLFNKARAIFLYDSAIKNLILRLKYADAHYVVPFFAEKIVAYMAIHNIQPDYIIPVPAHYRRIWQRKYNQSALLAGKTSALSQIPCLMQGLKRVKFNTQKNATRLMREQNLKNAFICPESIKARIYNKKILLIDDVMTSGATIHECSKALLSAKVHSINVLTVARATLHKHDLKIDF
jgi:ComF family protein